MSHVVFDLAVLFSCVAAADLVECARAWSRVSSSVVAVAVNVGPDILRHGGKAMDTLIKVCTLMWALCNIPCCIYTHIATWYEHLTLRALAQCLYAWIVGYGLAIAIDGVSLMFAVCSDRMVRRGYKGG